MRYTFIIITILFLSCTSKKLKDDDVLVLIQQVKPGMNREQVLRIIGDPDDIVYGVVDSTTPNYIYFYHDQLYFSRLYVTVVVDSLGKVLFTSK